jgi:hypothetical protein
MPRCEVIREEDPEPLLDLLFQIRVARHFPLLFVMRSRSAFHSWKNAYKKSLPGPESLRAATLRK